MEEKQGFLIIGEPAKPARSKLARAWLATEVSEVDATEGRGRGRDREPLTLIGDAQVAIWLDAGTEPVGRVVREALRPKAEPMFWAITRGGLEDGRQALAQARLAHERLTIRTGRSDADELLAGMAPALAEMLHGLTDRQREVARLALVDGLRQAEVAERLGVRRATVSVAFARARVHAIDRLVVAMRKLIRDPEVDSAEAPVEATVVCS